MSRIGNQPIELKSSVKVSIDGKTVKVQGGKGSLQHNIPRLVNAELVGGKIVVTRENDSQDARSLHGLTRTLINNMVNGVDKGFKKELEIRGVGYRAQVSGANLTLQLGYSQPVEYSIPQGITVSVEQNTKITVEGMDKQRVGQTAAEIREFRKPEPYKGKGIRYIGEYVIQKEGKTV